MAPNQIGIGRWIGKGARPAPVTLSNLPSKVTDSSVHRRRINATCSVIRWPRLEFLVESLVLDGVPADPDAETEATPESKSTSAACFATSTVCRWGRITIPVTSSSGEMAAK